MDQPVHVSYVSSNAAYTVMETPTPLELSPAILSKTSSVSYDNATWHTDSCKQDATATSCKVFQTLYLYLTAQF